MQHKYPISRRTFLLGAASLSLLTGCKTTPQLGQKDAESRLSELEVLSGGRIGVSAMNKANGLSISHRGGERFAMCSSFKWLVAYFMVVQNYPYGLDRKISYTRSDLVTWSPITEPAVDQGGLTILQLCEAAVQMSDNTATNLLVRELGGPEGLTALIREKGDTITRLDRWEPELNENMPGDPRDTSTPNAMTGLMSDLLFGDRSGMNEVALVKEIMMGAKTGDKRLRAGIGEGWIVGDKTGTSSNNQSNDVGFAFTFPTNYTRGRGPVIITSYLNVPDPTSPAMDKLHQEIARVSMAALT